MEKHLKTFAYVTVFIAFGAFAARAESVDELIQGSGFKGGLIVQLGCGDGKETLAMRIKPSFLVHGLDADQENIEKARANISKAGLAGSVLVERLRGKRLPYTDNLVNVIFAEDSVVKQLGISKNEILRVLTPRGVAFIKTKDGWEKRVKPWPDNIDEWRHFMHGPDNNGVANDTVVGIPYGVQWVSGPRYTRHHDSHPTMMGIVSAGGKLFYIIDESEITLLDYKPKWFLVARDAFNGLVLWKKEIKNWLPEVRLIREMSYLFQHRIVATPDKLFVTMSLSGRISEIDTRTGEVLKEYEGTENTVRILVSGSTLLAVTSDYGSEEEARSVFSSQNEPSLDYDKKLIAFDIRTGKRLWSKEGEAFRRLILSGVAIAGNRLYCLFDKEVKSYELQTGKPVWSVSHNLDMTPNRYNRRVVPLIIPSPENNVLVFFNDKRIQAFSLDKGKEVWGIDGKRNQYYYTCSGNNMFIVGDEIWFGSYPPIVVDAKTGKRVAVLPKEFQPEGHHARCYPSKATIRYLMTVKRGTEFYDMTGKEEHQAASWVRGLCAYGTLPCNGLLYSPPDSCSCYLNAKLNDLIALTPYNREMIPSEAENILVKGPAYGKLSPDKSASDLDWPMFRRDPGRKGILAESMPDDLQELWKSPALKMKITPPVIAGDSLVFAEEESGVIHCLKRTSGKEKWTFPAYSRIITAPALHKGAVLFGARNGWVYCLNGEDGKLAWRLRIAPKEFKTISYEKLESLWPSYGSVLILNDTLFALAGRSSFLNGGLFLYAIDIPTGTIENSRCITSPRPREPRDYAFSMDGMSNDILNTDGENIFVNRYGFTQELKPTEEHGMHLYCNSGLYDDKWFYRSFWSYGYGVDKLHDGPIHNIRGILKVPGGQIISVDDENVYGLATRMSSPLIGPFPPGIGHMTVLTAERMIRPGLHPQRGLVDNQETYSRQKKVHQLRRSSLSWKTVLPFQSRAMAGSKEKLFVAGWNEVMADGSPIPMPSPEKLLPPTKNTKITLPRDHSRVKKTGDGSFWVCSKRDGKVLKKYQLPSGAIFDGLAIAHGSVFISLEDGSVVCYGNK